MKIGLIDSGLGGWFLSKRLGVNPLDVYAYTSGYPFTPYGTLTPTQLKYRVNSHLHYLQDKPIDCIVVGCMTISATLNDYIRDEVDVPVYDLYSTMPDMPDDTIILCTNLSAQAFRSKYKNTIVCSELASLIERGFDRKTIRGFLRGYLTGLAPNLPIFIGCTHYIAIMDLLREIYQPKTIITPDNYVKIK